MKSIGRVDAKLDDHPNIMSAIRAEMLLIITNNEAALEVEVLSMFNAHEGSFRLILKFRFIAVNVYDAIP